MKIIVTRQAFSPPDAILTKIFLILTVVLILTFASCKPDDEDGSTMSSEETVTYASDTSNAATDFSYYLDSYDGNSYTITTKPLSNMINDPASVTIKAGKVSINLGIPKELFLLSEEGVIVTPKDAKGIGIPSFYTADGKYMLSCITNSNSLALLTYVDRDVNAKFPDYSIEVNWKQGWNYLISSGTAFKTLPSGYKWTVTISGYVYGTLTITGVPSGTDIDYVYVFNSGTNISTANAIENAINNNKMQAYSSYSSSSNSNSFKLRNENTSRGWTGSGSFPVVLKESGYSDGYYVPTYKTTTVTFTEGDATVAYNNFTSVPTP